MALKRLLAELQAREWRIRLRRSGFRDLENHNRPDCGLSDLRHPARLRGLFRANQEVPEDGSGVPSAVRYANGVALRVQGTEAYYRRLGALAWKLPMALDRDIALAISDGEPVRAIKSKLRVGQGRVYRVRETLHRWLPTRFWARAG